MQSTDILSGKQQTQKKLVTIISKVPHQAIKTEFDSNKNRKQIAQLDET